MCSHLIQFINTFYKCNFGEICKDDAAINCTTVQRENWLILVNFDWTYVRLGYADINWGFILTDTAK
jgi:hypothetical protein